jgi:prepilin-type N-terminal cleavage/methylation domain-containing protein
MRRSIRTRRARTTEAGFSLVELLIALVVMGLVTTAALGFFRAQSAGFRRGADRFTVMQNARFAVTALEKDLRTAGGHLTDGQPSLVYAGSLAVAFNADFATNDSNDPFAIYYEPEAPDSAVISLGAAQAIQIPGTSFTYPDTTYRSGGAAGAKSAAETITFVFRPDSTTSRTDDWVLLRQVNDETPELVARNLLRSSDGPFFQYEHEITPASGLASIDTVPTADLPLEHSVAMHGSAADTGSAARIDSVRAVRVRLTSTNGQQGADERTEAITRLVRIPNNGVEVRKTCGDEPILGTSLTATPGNLGTGDPEITLTWNAATDESGGEKDVVRYVLWRRPAGGTEWGDPLLSIPAGNSTYTYTDTQIQGGNTYDYALAAQDCTPTLSSLTTASSVTAPMPTSPPGG